MTKEGNCRPATAALVISLVILLCSSIPASAQNDLNRISTMDRSDGLGHVIRYHLAESVDSFQVIQPKLDLIQMVIYSDQLDASNVQMPDLNGQIENIHLARLSHGYGVDIELKGDYGYKAAAYPDQNGRDLLLSLTMTDRDEVLNMTADMEPVQWEEAIDAADPFTAYDDSYLVVQDNLRFDTVVIDAGHGGKDPGSIGHNNLREKDITLAVAQQLGEYINEYLPDVNVIYTRDDDTFVELEERGHIANRARGDLFVSIHANSFNKNRSVKGTEIYFLGLARSRAALEVMKRENSVVRLEEGNGVDELTEEDLLIYELANAGNISISERIAGALDQQFRERAQRPSRGVKQAQFMVLYHASMPAILVELGFITNPDEARYLSTEYGQSIVASAIFRAIRDYKVEYERSRNITSTD